MSPDPVAPLPPPLMEPSAHDETKRPGPLWVTLAFVTTVLLLVPKVLALRGQGFDSPEASGRAVGGLLGTLLIPVLVAALFTLIPSFRSTRRMVQVYTVVALFCALALLSGSLNAP